jgi:Family of unknown function (DUF5677)
MAKHSEYSHASAEARTIGVRLVELSQGYEDQKSSSYIHVGAVALVVRSRRLLRAAYMLADGEHGLEAAHLLRAMTEAAITLRWLGLDAELNFLRWVIEGTKRVLSHDDALRRLERRRRKEAGLPAETDADEPLGLLLPKVRLERFEPALAARRADLAAIQNLEDRLEPASSTNKKTPEKRAERLPSLERRASLAGLIAAYDIAYRWDSNAAAHASSLAVEQLLTPGDETAAAIVAAAPTRHFPDPYAAGALFLALTLETAGEQIPALAVGELDELATQLQALRPFSGREIEPNDQA